MRLFILSILIGALFGLYSVKCVRESHDANTLGKTLKTAVKKALYVTLIGIVVVGLACLALYFFPLVRLFGFSIFPEAMIDKMRLVLDIFFDTQSVYAAIEILLSIALAATEVSLIFSILGFFAIKTFGLPCIARWLRGEETTEYNKFVETVLSHTPKKLFLNFAHLRI